MTTTAAAPDAGPDWALFLDVDGTLIDLAETPDAVRVPPRLPDLLTRLRDALGGGLALVSGRPVAVLDRFFYPARLAAIGLHGAEWRARPEEPVIRDPVAPPPPEARAALEAFAAANPGVVVEDKGVSLALHFRRAPQVADRAVAAARAAALPVEGYSVLPGKMMVEIKPAHVNKGAALRRAMARPPFAGRVAVFAGDDLTDEDGFAAVNQLRGHSIKVGGADPSAARYRLPDVAAVHAWLEDSARRLFRPARPS
jgi:trehalose 6-phosphate phosphatase